MALRSSRIRTTTLLLAAAVALPAGLAACGDDQVDQSAVDRIEAGGNGAAASLRDNTVTERQNQADEDARAAEQARKRREELAALEAEQKAETDKILKDGVPGGNDEDATIPLGAADPELEKFRARLAGVCDGASQRIVKVSKKADKVSKTNDPVQMLAVAQEYNDVLNDFSAALDRITPPDSVKQDYEEWQGTMDALAANVRQQLVSQGDPKAMKKLQTEFQTLSAKLVTQTAALGVVCLPPDLS